MFPGMVFCILSTDADFVQDMAALLRHAGAEVYVAGTWNEYQRLQEEGVSAEMTVVDPVFRLACSVPASPHPPYSRANAEARTTKRTPYAEPPGPSPAGCVQLPRISADISSTAAAGAPTKKTALPLRRKPPWALIRVVRWSCSTKAWFTRSASSLCTTAHTRRSISPLIPHLPPE